MWYCFCFALHVLLFIYGLINSLLLSIITICVPSVPSVPQYLVPISILNLCSVLFPSLLSLSWCLCDAAVLSPAYLPSAYAYPFSPHWHALIIPHSGYIFILCAPTKLFYNTCSLPILSTIHFVCVYVGLDVGGCWGCICGIPKALSPFSWNLCPCNRACGTHEIHHCYL